MKRIYTSATLSIASSLLAVAPVFAQEEPPNQSSVQVDAPFGLGGLTMGAILTFLIQAAFVIAAILALVFLIWGGIQWITSGGDSEGVAAARNRIIAAVIGLAVVILAFFVLNFVLDELLGVGNLINGLDFCSLRDVANDVPGC